MTDKEKLEKIKSLSDKMYTSMQNLTTDTAPIRKAMNEYHQFIIQHWHEKRPVSEDLEEAADEYANSDEFNDKAFLIGYDEGDLAKCFIEGAKWQREQMIDKACEWLSNVPIEDMTYKYDDFSTSEGWYKLIDDFRKAMED